MLWKTTYDMCLPFVINWHSRIDLLQLFLFFGLRSVKYTETEEREKRGRPGNTYHVNDVRWMRGGHRRGGGVVPD